TEYFNDKENVVAVNSKVFETTLSANFKVSNLTIIPELRLDNASQNIFSKNNGDFTKNTASAILAAVYSF
ncbi:MAG TPA: outer membrane beta-barrel protein, partial [Segetibacter sp.]|nr:outer membrane beta-barrel protein [Segetibacter sp.]